MLFSWILLFLIAAVILGMAAVASSGTAYAWLAGICLLATCVLSLYDMIGASALHRAEKMSDVKFTLIGLGLIAFGTAVAMIRSSSARSAEQASDRRFVQAHSLDPD